MSSDPADEAWFKREIAPKLDGYGLKEIAKARGLSLAACWRIRAGARVPHPRQWEALRELVDGKKLGRPGAMRRSGEASDCVESLNLEERADEDFHFQPRTDR